MGCDPRAGIDRQNIDRRLGPGGLHQPHFQRGRTHARQDIAAGRFEINQAVLDADLRKEIVHIRPRIVGPRQHGDLGRHRIAAAQPVNIQRMA